jgi:hypothetical protein
MLPEIETDPGIGQNVLFLILLASMHQRYKANPVPKSRQMSCMEILVARPTGKNR